MIFSIFTYSASDFALYLESACFVDLQYFKSWQVTWICYNCFKIHGEEVIHMWGIVSSTVSISSTMACENSFMAYFDLHFSRQKKWSNSLFEATDEYITISLKPALVKIWCLKLLLEKYLQYMHEIDRLRVLLVLHKISLFRKTMLACILLLPDY